MKPRIQLCRQLRRSAPLAACCGLAFAPPVHAAITGSWNANAAGNWTDATKWTGGIPNGEGDTANLTIDISAARTISTVNPQTVGNLAIGDPATPFFAYTINAGGSGVALATLTFDQSGTADAIITVPATATGTGANSIVVPYVALKDNLTIDTQIPDISTTQLSISSMVTDGASSLGITKAGPGIAQLAAPNSFDGGVTVSGGRLNANNLLACGSGGVTVGAGQLYAVGNLLSNVAITGTGYANSADAAAQAGALRVGNLRTLFGSVTVNAASRLGVHAAESGWIVGNLSGSAALDVNGPSTTTGTLSLTGSAAAFAGVLKVASGGFNYSGALGGSLAVAPAAGATVTVGLGTAVGGDLTLDGSGASATLRNLKGVTTIAGNLDLTGSTAVAPSTFPAVGAANLTLMTYAAKTGTGSLTLDATGYRGSPTVSAGATSAVVSGLDIRSLTWSGGSGLWDVSTTAVWSGGDTKFFHGDAVTFGDTAFGTVTLDSVVRPKSVTFNSTGSNDYTLAGTGGIDACGDGLTKSGDAWLYLGGTNTLTGPVNINQGRLILSSKAALGHTSGVTIASGAALDLNGQDLLGASRVADLTIAGPGDGTVAALANTGAAITFAGGPKSGIRNVTLAADAAIGGDTGKTFDISGTLDGGGFTLTKTGANQIYLLGPAKNVHIVVEQGTLAGFGPATLGPKVTIKPGAVLQYANSGSYPTDIVFDGGGKLELTTGSENIVAGTITATGDAEISNGNTSTTFLTIAKDFAVGGNLTRSGGGSILLLGTASVTGTLTINGGPLMLGFGGTTGAISPDTPIAMGGTTPSLVINRSDNISVPNPISGTNGAIRKQGAGTATLTADNSYTGTTTVSAGTLLINGSHSGTGNVTVNAGTTLGGTGTIPGAVTAAGTVAPGAGGIGTLTLGSAGKTTTINGTLAVEFDGSAPQATDKLTVVDSLTLGAASVLDCTAVGGALTGPAYLIASYGGTLTGAFATVNKPAGYDLTYSYNDGTSSNNIALVKVAVNPYDAWLAGYPALTGGNRAPAVDFDNDGLDNGVEFVIGSDPAVFTASETPGYPKATVVGGGMVFAFKRSTASKAYPVSVETSVNLVTWPPADTYPIPVADGTGGGVVVAGESVTVTIPMAGAPTRFARLKVEIPFTP